MLTGPTRAQIDDFIRQHFSNATRKADYATALCPFHDDHHATNFRINLTHGGYNCFACSAKGHFFELVAHVCKVTVKEARTKMLGEAAQRSAKARTFEFTDLDGQPLYREVRLEGPDGKKLKQAGNPHQERADGKGGWVKGAGCMKGVERILYRLKDVIHADEVFIVEGPHKVEILREWGLVATTNSEGALKWTSDKGYNHYFIDKNVICLPDNDPYDEKRQWCEGLEHMNRIARQLRSAGAKSVKVVMLPDLPHKGDIYEWKQAGGTKEKLLKLTDAAPEWKPPEGEPTGQQKIPWNHFNLDMSGDPPGVYYHNGDGRDHRICSPLKIVAATRDEYGENHGRLLEWQDPDDRKHTWAMPMEMLAGNGEQFRARLLAGGVEMGTSKENRQLLSTYVQTTVPTVKACAVSKVGWQGNIFVLPDQVIGDSKELYFYQSPADAHHNLRVSGKLEEWREHVGELCRNNSRLLLAVGCAFAAPLVTPTDGESGGFHFYGQTSSGKSTALFVAGSVWGGGPGTGYSESWRNTANGLESFGEIHNDGLGCLDELAQIEPRILSETLYMLANGQGKGRMNKNITARRRLSWTLLFLSSGEITLNEHAEVAGRTLKTGVEIRLVNISADAGLGLGMFESKNAFATSKQLAEKLKENALKYYGSPIRKFLQLLVDNKSGAVSRIRTERDEWARTVLKEFYRGKESPNEVARAARRFALVATAGELATEWNLTGWRKGECSDGVRRCLHVWLQEREPSDAEMGIKAVRQFIALHGASRFQILAKNDVGEFRQEDRIINRAGYRQESFESGTQYLIFPEVFRSEVCKGFDAQAVARELKLRGLISNEGPSLMKQVRVPGSGKEGRARFYVISGEILDG